MATQYEDDRRFDARDRLVGRREDDDPVIRLEIYGILIIAFAVALLLALITFDPADLQPNGSTRPRAVVNAIGPVGANVGNIFLGIFGLGAFALAGTFLILGLSYVIGRRSDLRKLDILGWFGVLLGGAVLLHVSMAPARMLGHLPGGGLGEYVGEILRAFLSTPGTILLAVTVLAISAIALTRRSLFELGAVFVKGGRAVKGLLTMGDAPADDLEGAEEGDEADEADEADEVRGRRAPRGEAKAEEEADPDDEPDGEGPVIRERRKAAPVAEEPEFEQAAETEAEPEADLEPESDPEPETANETPTPKAAEAAPLPEAAPEADGADLKIVESAAMRRSRSIVVGEQLNLDDEDADKTVFESPSLSLLDYRPPTGMAYDREFLTRNAQLLEAKLADYRVKGKVVEIHPGPVVTMYEFRPAAGVKISAIANLADDLAMALSALRIRIVAPIPGKDVVGIEVPNKAREMVWLKEILSDKSYTNSKSRLTLALGKDIAGNPTTFNLAKAPHLLVAGATGSGKSVAINSFICSILYSATPEDVRMIMVDPKMLELSIYEGIPHLLLPVVTDPKEAATALRWAVKEMERRYKLMADMGVRNLANFNKKALSLIDNPGQELPERLKLARSKRSARGEPDPEGVVLDADARPIGKLPLIVVIVDELADLMMVASKEVEHCIARLAQMARASGIHLVLATQRPSVDVITGLIKANFPTRISFQVASKIDSRTILDQKGAEALLGNGDMLFMPPGTSTLKRVHGTYVSEEEIHRIVLHLRDQGTPDYDLGILTTDEDGEDGGGKHGGSDVDELYDRAVVIVAETRNASISFLQRKLKIGYNRSARIVEEMERDGIVGPSDGTSRPREVFIDPM